MSDGAAIATAAGCAGGAANCFVGFPFDSVKVRLQASQRGTFKGPYHCFRHIVRTEGVAALYRGLSVPLIAGAVETGINYAVYTQCLPLIEGRAGATARDSSLLSVAAAAAVAGVALSPILSPAELVKCRLQMGASARPRGGGMFNGPGECIRHLLRTEGPRGLTRGLSGTLARETFGNALFFTVYETLRRQIPGRAPQEDAGSPQPISVLAILTDSAAVIAAGGFSGMCMWAAVLPIDVAKSRMQIAQPGTKHDRSLAANLRMLYRERGLRGCYPGLSPVLLRSFPANAAQWLVYELIMRSA
mmetsp:Transcript_14356/g.43357  ORF Transcript_14356/g.43357 Transcript_14356/m.43357 type:complete len:303 (-) Transcript_14356:2366-3274(-)